MDLSPSPIAPLMPTRLFVNPHVKSIHQKSDLFDRSTSSSPDNLSKTATSEISSSEPCKQDVVLTSSDELYDTAVSFEYTRIVPNHELREKLSEKKHFTYHPFRHFDIQRVHTPALCSCQECCIIRARCFLIVKCVWETLPPLIDALTGRVSSTPIIMSTLTMLAITIANREGYTSVSDLGFGDFRMTYILSSFFKKVHAIDRIDMPIDTTKISSEVVVDILDMDKSPKELRKDGRSSLGVYNPPWGRSKLDHVTRVVSSYQNIIIVIPISDVKKLHARVKDEPSFVSYNVICHAHTSPPGLRNLTKVAFIWIKFDPPFSST